MSSISPGSLLFSREVGSFLTWKSLYSFVQLILNIFRWILFVLTSATYLRCVLEYDVVYYFNFVGKRFSTWSWW
jgi:hypothetical protein